MNIAITFRHMEATESVKAYASEKVAKMQKFLRQPMRARVTLSVENKQFMCEVEINAGQVHVVASEFSDDMYASIDRVSDKLERQISHVHGLNVAKRKGGESAGAFAASAAAAEEGEEPSLERRAVRWQTGPGARQEAEAYSRRPRGSERRAWAWMALERAAL